MNILIISDDREFAEHLKNDLFIKFSEFNDSTRFNLVTDHNTETTSKQNYEFVFIDIDTLKNNGIILAKHIIDNQICRNIVFVSIHSHLIHNTLSVHPYFFIRKNNYQEDIQMFFELVQDSLVHHSLLLVKYLGQKQVIDINDVIYGEIDNGTLLLHCINNTYYDSRLLKTFLEECNPSCFVQINKSTVINLNYLYSFSNNEVTMKNKTDLKIGRAFKKSFNQKYKDYIRS